MERNEITERIIGAAIEVHRTLGPGLLEGIYEECLCAELGSLNLSLQHQKPIRIRYKDFSIPVDFRLDLLVEESIVVELKAVEKILPVHGAQLLSYLRMTGCSLGLLINFNVPVLKAGIMRVINDFEISASRRLCVEDRGRDS